MIICKQNVRGKEKGNIVGKQGKWVYVSMHPANLSESCSSQHWNYYNGLVLPQLNYIQPHEEFNLFISTSFMQIFLSLVLEEISLVLMRQQYHDMIELLESFDRMTTNSVFRKYKPNVPLHGHAAQW